MPVHTTRSNGSGIKQDGLHMSSLNWWTEN